MFNIHKDLIPFCSLILLFGFPQRRYQDIRNVPNNPDKVKEVSLSKVGADTLSLKTYSPIPIGVAIGYFPMKYNQAYDSIVYADFDNVTLDNALKNGSVVKPDGAFDYAHADELVKICTARGIHVYGHNLCWYQQVSPYVKTLQGDSAAIEHFLKKYITTTVTRYKNTIHAWDVVNEAINRTGGLRVTGPQRPGSFYWGKYLGAGYIARAFQYAHAADREALLFYNDYNLESDTAKLNGVINMINHLKAEKIPIRGVGTQMHVSINTSDKGIDHMFQELASTGLLIRISEMDIKVNTSNDPDFVMTKQLAEDQAAKCRYVLQSFFKYVPAKQRFGITFWDLGTKDSWLTFGGHRKGSPCLFDNNYKPKLMYYAVLNFFKKMKTTNAN
jgi:endo-1,4-beta-xylanase